MVFAEIAMRDEIYRRKLEKIEPFQFNEKVAHAFNDMASRSIPLYWESQTALAKLVCQSYKKKGIVYDLGCSTGNSLKAILGEPGGRQIKMVGIDNSFSMCRQARLNIDLFVEASQIPIICQDILLANLKNTEIVILNYVCQFFRPDEKKLLIKKIYDALPKSGLLIICEKLEIEDANMSQMFTKLYYDFKESKGYSQLEISQKRDALENVLQPLSLSDLSRLLKSSGFSSWEVFFKWFNFAGIVAIK